MASNTCFASLADPETTCGTVIGDNQFIQLKLDIRLGGRMLWYRPCSGAFSDNSNNKMGSQA